ncbi:unnamed protein product [Adineta steineri]|uniref:G-protein coupled receptors family 1 profile domain-containing protein n=1 Tax=Adineta steineri TaxID=433720 RepID=A0A814S5K7_9BILA|nr:unnamed protein product [Adineta steineri]CAF1143563.1 unnamed protein product [Adineta steineri]
MTIATYNVSWIILGPLIPSVLVSIFNLYHVFSSRALLKALNNHVVVLLLCFGLVYELTLDILYTVIDQTLVAPIQTPAFCYAWALLNSSIPIIIYLLMAWAAIERHILVFHANWFGTQRKRILYHYTPLALCIIWPMVFYITTLFIIPCSFPLNYKVNDCGFYSCITRFAWLALFDSIGHYMVPIFLIVIFSVSLFVRVLYNRYRARGQIEWKNYQKMALQLLPISMLYIVLQFPWVLMYALYSAGVPSSAGASFYHDIRSFSSWAILFTPFATVMSLPELGKKCRQLIFFWRPQRAVHPQAFTVNRQNGNQTVLVPLKRMASKTPVATKPAEVIQTTTQPTGIIQTTTQPTGIIQTTTEPTGIIQTTTEPTEATTPVTKILPTMASVTTTLMTKPETEMTPIDI